MAPHRSPLGFRPPRVCLFDWGKERWEPSTCWEAWSSVLAHSEFSWSEFKTETFPVCLYLVYVNDFQVLLCLSCACSYKLHISPLEASVTWSNNPTYKLMPRELHWLLKQEHWGRRAGKTMPGGFVYPLLRRQPLQCQHHLAFTEDSWCAHHRVRLALWRDWTSEAPNDVDSGSISQKRKLKLRETKWLFHLIRLAPTWFKPCPLGHCPTQPSS